MGLHELLIIGDSYSKAQLSILIDEPNLALVREGLYSCKQHRSILLFVDLVKHGKDERFHFNDYFQDDYFHWDSQTTQHFNSPRIQSIVLENVEVNLFVRIDQKVRNKSQPFKYCGRLKYIDYDPNTLKPVHLIFNSIDFDENNGSLIPIYFWKPENIGRTTANNDYKTKSYQTNRNLKKPNYTERKGLVTSRVGQGYYRQEILNTWENSCAVTNLDVAEILIASHIVPWKSSSDDERLDPNNGILLCPNIDALFDKHLISFDVDGKILISPSIGREQQTCLGIHQQMRLKNVHFGMEKYLSIHRGIFHERN